MGSRGLDAVSSTHHRNRIVVLLAATIVLTATACQLPAAIGSAPPSPTPGQSDARGTHTVRVHNDLDFDGELETFVFKRYTDTVQTLGILRSGEATTEDIHDTGQVEEALGSRDICDVGHPERVRPLRREVALDQIGRPFIGR